MRLSREVGDYDSHNAPRSPPRHAPSPLASSRPQTTFPDSPHGSPALPPETRARTGRQVGEPVGFPLAAAAPRSDSPASPAAPAAGAASPTLLGRGAAGPGAQSPGRDTPSPPSPPAGATPLGSSLALRGRRSPQSRAASRPGARIPAPALPQPPPLTLNMDSDSCAAAFHPEVSESCAPIAPDHPHPSPALAGARPPRAERRPPLPQLSLAAAPPPRRPAPPPIRARAPSSRRPSPRRPFRGRPRPAGAPSPLPPRPLLPGLA